jgi:thioredoxin 1
MGDAVRRPGYSTMLFVANGKVVHTQVGALPEQLLKEVLGQFMALVSAPEPAK